MAKTRLITALALSFLSSSYSYSQPSQGLQTYQFDIQKQSVNSALIDLALQQNLNIVYLAEITKSLQANPLQGNYTLAQALNHLLQGTKLRASIVNNRVIQIEKVVLKPRPFNYKSYYEPLPPNAKDKPVTKPDAETKEGPPEPVETIVVVGKIMSPYNMGTTVSSTKTQRDFLSTAQVVNALPEELATDTSSRNYSDVISYVSSVTYLERSSGITDELRLRGFAYPSLKINGIGAHAYIAPVDLAFIDRIEIAKGPSSVLFGRMEPGGLVNMMLKQPDGTSSSITASRSSDDYSRLELDTQFSFTDDTAIRTIAFVQEQGDDVSVDLNDSKGAMITLNTQLEQGGEINFNYRYESETMLQQFGRPIEGFNNEVFFFRGDDNSIEVVAPREEDVRSGLDANRQSVYLGFNDLLLGNWSADLHFQQDKYQAKTLVSYPVIEEFIVDFNDETITNTELNAILRRNPELFEQLIERLQTISINDDSIVYDDNRFAYDTEFFSAEFTLYQNKSFQGFELEQLYGVNFNDSKPQSLIWQNHDSRSNFIPAGQTEVLADFQPDETEVKDVNLGVFGQWVVDWDTFTLFLGARADKISLSVVGESLDLKERFTELTYRIGGVYQLTDDTSFFANYSQSFSPQFQQTERIRVNEEGENEEVSRIIIPDPADSFQFELGIKQTWLDDRLQTNCSYYSIEKKDIAASVKAQSSKGLECDVAGSLGNDWHLVASISRLDAEVTDSEDEEFIGLKPRMTPEQTASVWLNKDLSISEQWHTRLGMGIKYVDERFINNDNEVALDDYHTVDFSISVEYGRHLNATFFIRNAFDKAFTQGVFNALPYWTNPGSGRTLESRISYKF